jgi:hypothetical protein
MAANPFNVSFEEDTCVICQHPLSEAQSYKLPECNHTFHTHCIVTWFRARPAAEDGTTGGKCPCCGDQGVNNLTRAYSHYGRRWRSGGDAHKTSHLALLRKESRKPDSPIGLKALVDKEARAVAALNDVAVQRREYKEYLKENVVDYAQASKKRSDLRRAYYNKYRAHREVQRALMNFPIIPIIIPMPLDLNWQADNL